VKLRLLVPAAALAALAGVSPASIARATVVPPASLNFGVELDQQSLRSGAEPNCTPSPLELGQAVATTGSADMSCTVTIKQSAAALSGTVSNAELAESDPGFDSGSLAMKCNMDQQVTTKMTITRTGAEMTSFSGKTSQACSWKMTFADAKSSTLAGTMEANGTLGSKDGSIDGDSVSIALALKVYMTQGTGAFAGYTGGGAFTRTESIDLDLPSSGGSSTPTPQPEGDALQSFCSQNGISPCTTASLSQFCQANPSKCSAPPGASSQSARSGRVASSGVRSFAEASALTLSLKKSSGAVRIISPAPPTGQPKAAATVTKSTRIQIVATKGANCQVKTNKGKVVAVKRITSDGTTTLKPKSGSLKGATSIRAFCKVGKKSISSNAVKIKSK
jgi:hypothetical protein